MNEIEWLNRYDGSIWHRLKMLLRGLVGIVFAIPLICFAIFMVVFEIGNICLDAILETSELGENSEK